MAEKETKLLTVREVSERTGAAIPTVNLWCRSGRLSGAYQESTPYGDYWLIPESALDGIVVRGRGRPPKSLPGTQNRATGAASASKGTATGRKKGGKK